MGTLSPVRGGGAPVLPQGPAPREGGAGRAAPPPDRDPARPAADSPGDATGGLPLQEQMRELVDWHNDRAVTPLPLAATFDFPAADVPP